MTFLILYLDGDPGRSLSRAVKREGPHWLDWLLQSLKGCQPGPVDDSDDVTDYLVTRRQITFNTLRRAQMEVIRLPYADVWTPQAVLADALSRLGQHLE